MKRIKRRLSLTLRGSQTIDESLSELAEQMTIEENSSKDSGECGQVCSYVCVQFCAAYECVSIHAALLCFVCAQLQLVVYAGDIQLH